ncbi:MAG: DUF937 domain-containing protein [Deltaproteobacteria bacterium]|nr:DUF937 domain-containing protein [Deltaproteobacteria bacterium]
MSGSILDVLSQQLGGDVVKQLSAQLGADEGSVNTAITAALPMLLGGLAKNSATPQGAEALSSALARDHDGGILDNLTGFLGSGNAGAGPNILGHVFGGKTDTVASALGQASGLNAGSAGSLLAMLAPVVMGALGRTQQQSGLDSGGLANMLGNERAQLEQSSSGLGGLMRMLDFDGDGQVMDNIGEIAGALGSLFRR